MIIVNFSCFGTAVEIIAITFFFLSSVDFVTIGIFMVSENWMNKFRFQ